MTRPLMTMPLAIASSRASLTSRPALLVPSPETSLARRAGSVDQAPVDHQLLRAEARPLDEAHRDALMRARLDGVDHMRIRDCRSVAFTLQQEFRMINAARDVRGQHEQEVDLLRRR